MIKSGTKIKYYQCKNKSNGDIVANITYTYLNLFTGELVYVNLPPIVNWRDELVPTINENSYTEQQTGIVNTVIAPIQEMIGDTMVLKASHYTSKKVIYTKIVLE